MTRTRQTGSKRLPKLVVAAIVLALVPALLPAQEAPRRWLKYVAPVVGPIDSLYFFIADAPNLSTPGAPNPDNLYSVNSDGSKLKRLTHDGAMLPRWIGGMRGVLTFAGATTGPDSGNIFAIKPDGTGRRLVATVPGRNPVMSPDGTKIAYLVGLQRETEIWVADPISTRRVAGGGGTTAWSPAWDPDSRRLAYTFSTAEGGMQVHVVKVDGAIRDTAVTDPFDQEVSTQTPAWSPDGKRLAVQWSNESGRGSRIAIIDLPTRRVKVLDVPPPDGKDVVRDEAPSWFPDGRRILFNSDRGPNVDVWAMNDDGSGMRQVTGIRQPRP